MAKILYVVTGLGLGGAEKVVADLADQMICRGHEVKIAYLTGDIHVRPQSDQAEIVYLGLEGGKDFIAASKKYRQLVRNYQPDVVHAHMVHANIFTRLNRIGCNVPMLISTAHNSNEGGKIRMLAYRCTNFLSDFNSNVSQEAVQAFIDKGAFTKKNTQHIYNGINFEKFTHENITKERSFNFLSVGRLNEQKDYPNLLTAAQIVTEQYKNIHFYIAGEGELRAELEKMIATLGLSNHVTLLGRRDDIPQLMHQASCFVLSSKYEGFGLVVAEAMACGTFVIATDCGGVKEVMGGQGILVPSQNSEELATAMLSVLEMPESEVLDNNVRALSYVHENFDLIKIADQWENIYASK